MSIRRYLEDGDRMYWFPRGHSRGIHTGPELLTNGGFDADSDWVKGAGWTISGGVATRTSQGSSSPLAQAVTLVEGAVYRVKFTMTAYTGGQVRPRFTGGTATLGTLRDAVGTYIENLTAVAGNNDFSFVGTAPFAGSIDNVSIRRVG